MAGLLDRFIANKRQFWREFLKLYQEMPELWDIHHADYRNKELRNGSYDILQNKLREIQPNATKSDVGRRINIFRTNYRREQMRIWKQQDLGLHADLCKPTLWFYENMSFLLTQESFQQRDRKMRCKASTKGVPFLGFTNGFNMDPFDTNTTMTALPPKNNCKLDPLDTTSLMTASPSIVNVISEPTAAEFDENLLLSPKMEILETELDPMQTESAMLNDVHKAEIADTSTSELNGPPSGSTSTTATVMKVANAQQATIPLSEASETLAKSWAIQYEEMAPTQRILARKAIADILFEGCMGNLRINRGERSTTVDNHMHNTI